MPHAERPTQRASDSAELPQRASDSAELPQRASDSAELPQRASDTAELLARHRAVLPSWLSLYYDEPLELVSGRGNRVTDAAGRTYLDFFAGILTNMVGYDLPELREAVEAQLRRGIVHTSTLYLLRAQVDLAERIARLSRIPDAKVFLTNSGTEANEAALLLATAYRRSNQVIALRNSYHGRGFGSMGVTGNRGWSSSSLTPFNVLYAQGGYRFRSSFRHLDDEAYVEACVTDLRELLAVATAGDVACLIAEPVQGVGGFATPPDRLLAAYKDVLDETGTLLISDEVQTGWGRTGDTFWGIEASGVVPDMMTFAKGLGGGFAIGGVVGRAEVMDCLQANSISTFGGNPIASVAANAVLDVVLSRDLQGNARRLGARLFEGLHDVAQRCPVVGEVRGKGLMVGVELVGRDGYAPAPDAAAAVLEETRRNGLLIGKGGLYGNVLRIAPPLTLTEDELEEGLEVLTGALEVVQKERG